MPSLLFIAALIALVLVGCDVAGTTEPSPQRRQTPTAVVTPNASTAEVESGETVTATVTTYPPTTEAPPANTGGAPSTPITVKLSMDKAPKVNEKATIVMEVRAAEDAPGTTAQIELPPGAQLVSGIVSWEGRVGVDSPAQLMVTILFTREGQYTIRGRALRPVSADMVWGDDDYIYLTVKTDAGFFGFGSGDGSQLKTGSGQ